MERLDKRTSARPFGRLGIDSSSGTQRVSAMIGAGSRMDEVKWLQDSEGGKGNQEMIDPQRKEKPA